MRNIFPHQQKEWKLNFPKKSTPCLRRCKFTKPIISPYSNPKRSLYIYSFSLIPNREKKTSAELLLLAKRVLKIKLASSNMPNAFTSFPSSFSSGFHFYVSLFSFHFFSFQMRWMPHSNSSSPLSI